LDDEQLIREVISGDPAAGREFVKRFSRLVSSIVLKYGKDQSERNDLYQNVFERLWDGDWRVLRGWRGTGPFGAYLRQVVERLCIDEFRARRVHEPLPEEPDDSLGRIFGESPEDPERETAFRRFRGVLDTGLTRLSDGCQAGLRMRFYEDRDYDEIARHFNSTANAAKTRLSRCLAEFRNILRVDFLLHENPI